MKIIYNTIIPFRGFKAINLFGTVFIRKECASRWYPKDANHEAIHTVQMRELLYVFFYIIYFFEWIIRLFQYRFVSRTAYHNISFEVEAYSNQDNMDYLKTRKHFSEWKKK